MRISGRLLMVDTYERLATWSDGIFALALTLIVIDLRTPINEITLVMAEDRLGLWDALVALGPRLMVYLLSVLTLGIFWMMQRAQLSHFDHPRRRILWTHAAFLFCVLMLPFSNWLLFEFIRLRLALIVYWVNLLALSGGLFMNWNYAERLKVLKPDVTHDIVQLNKNRIITCASLYTLAVLACAVSSALSIVCLLICQLIIAFAPRRVLDRAF